MRDPYAGFRSAVLPNGLTVHAAYWPKRPWEAVGFLIHSGAEYDPIGLEGLSHFVEHLVSQNANIPKELISTFFENLGGLVNLGATGYPDTTYRFFVPADKAILAEALSMFGHMLLSVQIEKSIEQERQIIINEFRLHYPAKFRFDLDLRERKALYAGSWLERFVRPFGAPESIERITKNDLQLHYDKHYTPANMSIVGVGGMTLPELIELISKSPFAVSKKGMRTPVPVPMTNVVPPLETRYVFELLKYMATETPVEACSYRSVAKIPGNVSAHTIRVFGKMLDKLLNEEVREHRAWTYSIGSLYWDLRYFHQFSINCGSLALKALDGIEEVVEDCIASIGDCEYLFKRTKERILAKSRITDSTGKDVCDVVLDDLANYQRIISLKEDMNNIEQVTMDDIRNLLRWLKRERRWTLITRP
jgi:predicted Zn-dependent peptidase